jgi:putative phosphoesterase
LLEGLSSAGVAHILHAGDVCSQRVLAELGELAPVSAVRGNRDFLVSPPLPMALELEFAGVKVGLLHGHGGVKRYWLDRFAYLIEGYRVERYTRLAENTLSQARVLVYGHSHRPENRWLNGRLIFNAGAAVGFRMGRADFPPSYGLLRFYAHGHVEGEIVPLHSVELRGGAWAKSL